MKNEDQPIICDLTVFSPATRKEMAAKVPGLFEKVQTVHELSDGFEFQFPNEPGIFLALADFVEHERQCCPFFHFTLRVPPNAGPLSLRMTGGEGVKAYVEATWQDLRRAVSRQLVQTGQGDDLDEAITRAAPILASTINKAGVSLE